MIERKKLLQLAGGEEERAVFSRLYDLAKSSAGGWRVSGFFLDPAKCRKALSWFADCEPVLWGGYEGAERQMIAFGESAATGDWFPLRAVRLTPTAPWQASHRDVLGAVLGLGLDRSKIGDILVTERDAVLFCTEPIAAFLREGITTVGRYRVTAEETERPEIPKKKYIEITDTVASLRADCVIAAIYALPRARAQAAISAGKVTVNWEELTSLSAELREGDVISLRGSGRSELTKIGGHSRKERIFISANRLV